MGDLTKLNEFMRQFLPLLLREQFDEKRVQRYLEKTLAEQEHWGGIRETGAQADQVRKIIMQLIETAQSGTKGMDEQLLAVLMRLGEAGVTDPALPTVSRERYGQAITPYADIGSKFAGLLEDKQYPSADDFSLATRVLGTEKVTEFQDRFEKKRLEEDKLVLQKSGQDIQRDKLTLEQRKQKKKEEEVAAGGTGKEAADRDKALYATLDKREKVLKDQLEEAENPSDPMTLEIDETKVRGLKSQIDKVRKQKMSLLKRMVKNDLDMKKVNTILSTLKSKNVKVRGIEQFKERFMAENGLTEIEYEFIKFQLGK